MMNRTMSSRSVWVFVISAELLIGACDESRRPRYVSGVDPTAPVSTLDDAQLREICTSFDGYVNTYVDLSTVAYISCLPVAIVTSLNSEACEATLQQCMNLFPTPIQVSARAQSDQVCFENLQQCNASVALLESCVNVNVDLAITVLDRLSCNRAADPNYRATIQPMADLVNVCADVNDACNTFADVQRPD